MDLINDISEFDVGYRGSYWGSHWQNRETHRMFGLDKYLNNKLAFVAQKRKLHYAYWESAVLYAI